MKTAAAISHFGSQGALAKALNVSQPAISKWGEEVPILRAYQIEVLTQGKLKVTSPLLGSSISSAA
ncbi:MULTISPECIES: Cro/CI family transcriptional regulator [Shewanella]|uniref:Cro/CI family transcriptional regulator n=1 Tax=Shewanella holmiensis TaxID=2952222 RepID=A0A9X2WN00_9GAMM|nr:MULTISPECIES: Cro/CI family transcriptional regulator [Shewanella]MCT7942414.1 Cro/CI family transcriptional regulator [Shewanella holmiensis]MDP5145493.1 Cro/CI family transcriptional regulator [Shewanella sp. ULN5]